MRIFCTIIVSFLLGACVKDIKINPQNTKGFSTTREYSKKEALKKVCSPGFKVLWPKLDSGEQIGEELAFKLRCLSALESVGDVGTIRLWLESEDPSVSLSAKRSLERLEVKR